ncbi:MAG: dihydrodipicolinate synthase family protein [Opitutaceae bacterium]|nr:dihydrodipicolinate synthase family protein [Opitutaceae bacterium]
MKSSSVIHFWSATPTPLTADRRVDDASVERMVRDALANRITGLFLGGTCGEGPWLPNRERSRLVKAVAAAAGGRLELIAQVSDNSVARIVDNMRDAAEAGATMVMIASPATLLNGTPDRIAAHFEEAVAASPLPVGIYDLGAHRPHAIPVDRLKRILLLPKVRLVKDSSGQPERQAAALAARAEKPSLLLFNGDEFACLKYLEAGYNGFMFGGAVAVGPHMHRIAELFLAGRLDEARAADEEMRQILYAIYGGKNISCWLTGLKYYMVRKGIFATTESFLGYPLTDECRAAIERYVQTGSLR